MIRLIFENPQVNILRGIDNVGLCLFHDFRISNGYHDKIDSLTL